MSKAGQPRLSQTRIPQASSTNAHEDASKTTDKTKKDSKKGDKKSIDFQLPPLSIVGKKKEIDFEQIRKKVIRRGNPEGEDKKQLASILKHLRESKAKIRVQEYVNLVSKFTCDNGEAMRNVMEEDIASFRKLVTKVYENMTQDVSDVLVNEQIQTANFYQERYDMFNNKMLWMISEIFQMIPEFDFEKYAQDKEDFLKYVCPIPPLINRDSEDINIQKRQEAFHRLQWLKIEEDRLAEENRRLEKRLEELKKQHKRETTQANLKTKIMEERKQHLADQEQEKQEHLNELEGLLGKNIVRTEAYIRLEADEAVRLTRPRPRVEAKIPKRTINKKEWSLITATTMEENAAKKLFESESAMADERKRVRRRSREPARQTTLFGESSMNVCEYPEFTSTTRLQEKTIQQTTTTVQEKRPPPRRSNSKGGCPGGCR